MCYRIGTLGKTNDDDLGRNLLRDCRVYVLKEMKYFMKVLFLILPTLLMSVIPSRPEARKLLEIAPKGAPVQSPANEPYSRSLIIEVPSDAPDASPFVSRMDGRD
ncbi:hypothetical protein SUGI_0019650 [Cryptomeria japonica]|nr:hypothetical protein SUGI_0019650 [Cryptomeria japonica]